MDVIPENKSSHIFLVYLYNVGLHAYFSGGCPVGMIKEVLQLLLNPMGLCSQSGQSASSHQRQYMYILAQCSMPNALRLRICICDADPALNRHWRNASCLLGKCKPTTLAQHWPRIGSMSLVSWESTIFTNEWYCILRRLDPICHSNKCQIGSFSSEATTCTCCIHH